MANATSDQFYPFGPTELCGSDDASSDSAHNRKYSIDIDRAGWIASENSAYSTMILNLPFPQEKSHRVFIQNTLSGPVWVCQMPCKYNRVVLRASRQESQGDEANRQKRNQQSL
jgi:hypothetical protein